MKMMIAYITEWAGRRAMHIRASDEGDTQIATNTGDSDKHTGEKALS